MSKRGKGETEPDIGTQLRSGNTYTRKAIRENRSNSKERNKSSLYPSLDEIRQLNDGLDHEYDQHNNQLEDTDDDNDVNDDKQEIEPKESQVFSFITIVILIIALISSYFFFDGNRFLRSMYVSNKDNLPLKGLSDWPLFESKFSELESKYGEVLPQNGFKVMKSAVKRILNKTSFSLREPAVILFVGSKGQTHAIDCIVNDFVNAIHNNYNENNLIKINGYQTNSNDIIEKFEETFASKQNYLIIVENIESISTNHIMALHQFTDHENARFPDAIILLTAIHYQNITLNRSARLRDMDEIATQLFEMKWKNSMAEDQRNALISRLTPSVVTILDTNRQIKC